MHLVVTVSNHSSLSRSRSHSVLCEVIVIIAPPQKVAYPFILDLSGYGFQIVYLFVVLVSVLFFLPPDPTINLKTGFFLSPLGKAQYTTAFQRHVSQLALSTNLELIGLCSVAPSSIPLPSCYRLLCVSKYLSCHIPDKLRQICTVYSACRTIHTSAWWHRRHSSAALLPLLLRRRRCASLWGALLGILEACAAVRIRLPPRTEEGGTQGWNSRDTGEQPRCYDVH